MSSSNYLAKNFVVANSIDAMLGYWDANLRCRYSNAAYEVWFGRSTAEMLDIPMHKLLGHLYELNLPYIDAALRGEVQHFERTIALPDGTLRYSLASYHPDISANKVIGFSAHVVDITRIRLRETQLESKLYQAQNLATQDFLTGLPNRVRLIQKLSAAITRADIYGSQVAVIAIDLDHFKPLNDTYGHDFGDAVLKQIAARMKQVIRGSRTIKRVGGDEFIYIAPDLNSAHEASDAIAELMDLVSTPFHCGDVLVRPSLSCGVALYPRHGFDPQSLLQKADRALYWAKRNGGSKIVFVDSVPEGLA